MSRAGGTLVWFRPTDLRVRDHAPLINALTYSASVNYIFCFDPREVKRGNSMRMSKRRFKFLFESVINLDNNLSKHCVLPSNDPIPSSLTSTSSSSSTYSPSLTLVCGNPEDLIPQAAKWFDATSIFTYDQVAYEEKKTLEDTRRVFLGNSSENQSLSFKLFTGGGSRLFDENDCGSMLPFNLQNLPPTFSEFRKLVESVSSQGKSALDCIPKALDVSPPNLKRPLAKGLLERNSLCNQKEYESLASSIISIDNTSIDDLWQRLLCYPAIPISPLSNVEATIGVSDTTEKMSHHSVPMIANEGGSNIISDALHNLENDDRGVLNFKGGEDAALDRIAHYFTTEPGRITTYLQTRNGLIGPDYSTKFSPWLATGCVSARTILDKLRDFESESGIKNDSTNHLVFELLWRDYLYLYAFKWGNRIFALGGPQGLHGEQKHVWGRDKEKLDAWKQGMTGYPFIDANLRELLLTGWMSNRGRQVVASFLVRDLQQDWREGAKHFQTFLLDHDVCSNWGSWQYSAGVGADPRDDRYFNIVKQVYSYDPGCAYIRRWCPEIAQMSDAFLAAPHTTDASQEYEVKSRHVGGDHNCVSYPRPICELLHGSFDEASFLKKQKKGKQKRGSERPPSSIESLSI